LGALAAVLGKRLRPLIPTFTPARGEKGRRAPEWRISPPFSSDPHAAVDLAQSGPDKERA